MIIRERYLAKIRPFMNKPIIKILTGMRRSGKSVLMSQIQDEMIRQGVERNRLLTFNFESAATADIRQDSDLYACVRQMIGQNSGRFYLFFDEIQEVQRWEKCVAALQVDFDVDIYITGSNARILSSELATYIAGRYVSFTIFPLSFAEVIELHSELGRTEMTVPNLFRNYLLLGGMPFLHHLDYALEPGLLYLGDVYSTVVLKDILMRQEIRDAELLDRMILYVIANIGQPFSANSIANFMKSQIRKAAPATIMNYLRACEEAFLIHRVPREDLIGKRILQINEKHYLVDHGLREAIYGNNMRDIGQVLKNIVALELLRRGYLVRVGQVGQKEVDFVAERRSERIYIQVAYVLGSQDVIDREFSALACIDDNYPKFVLSTDEFDLSRSGIQHQNIRDFLLSE